MVFENLRELWPIHLVQEGSNKGDSRRRFHQRLPFVKKMNTTIPAKYKSS